VLTTFAHSATSVIGLRVSGEPTLIGTTSQHPFWSEDQRDWVGATSLAVGERLSTSDGGEALALGWEVRDDEPVYNIEVDGDHCYRVGQQGLLVHNQSASPAWCISNNPGYRSTPVREATLFLRRQLNRGFIDNAPAAQLTATTLPIIRSVDAVLSVMAGHGVGGGVPDLFADAQYHIVGYDPAASERERRDTFHMAFAAGRQPAISVGHRGDTVGHIIGQQFGGSAGYSSPEVVVENVFPQSPGSQGDFNRLETMWRLSVLDGNKVCVVIRLNYSGGSYRPGSLTAEWWETCGVTGGIVHHPAQPINN